MVAEVKRVRIEIDAARAKTQLRGVKNELNATRKSAQGIEAQFRRFNSVFSLFAGAGGAGLIIKSLIQMVDGFNETASRLRLVSEDTVGYQQALNDLSGVALSTMTDLNGTITLYSRLAVATKGTQISHQDLLDVTEATALSLRLSGASAKESAAFMTQFSQALSSGKLSGDEFRSMLESNVVMTQALAKSLNTTVGGLREMSKEGELINSKILPALLESLDEFRDQAERLPVTVSRGVTNMVSGFTRLAAAIDKAAEATIGLGRGYAAWGVIFNRWAENIEFEIGRPDRLRGLVDNFERQRDLLQELSDKQREYVEKGLQGSDRWIALEQRLEKQFARTAEAAARLSKERLIIQRGAAGDIGQDFSGGEMMGPDAPMGLIRDRQRARRDAIRDQQRYNEELQRQVGIMDGNILMAWVEGQERIDESIRLSVDPLTEYVEQFEKLEQAALESVEPTHALLKEIQLLEQAIKVTGDETGALAEKIFQLHGKIDEELQGSVDDSKKNLDSLSVAIGQTMANAVDRLGDTMVDFAFGAKTSFSDMANSILKDIASMMVKFALMRIMFGGQTPGAEGNQGGLLSFLFNARGNAFSGGNVVPFARGGVVSRPTVFPMANGAGVMGDRGPEAVMPLMRDSKGRLGVSGGGTVINITNNTSGEVQTETSNGPSGEEIVNIVVGRVSSEIMTGGPTARAIEQSYGVRRTGYTR